MSRRLALHLFGIIVAVLALSGLGLAFLESGMSATADETETEMTETSTIPSLDAAAYDAKLRELARLPPVVTTEPDGEPAHVDGQPGAEDLPLWPVADAPYPEYGALLPFHRVVAYYGNFYSTGMGILGQYSEDTVLDMLRGEAAKWEEADPATPVIPGIDYIAVTAQWNPGADGMYRFRMPAAQIERAIDMAGKANGIVILEIQAGLSTVMEEARALEPYLLLPQVHLAIDPEFAMNGRGLPGRVVGTVDASQVNEVAEYLASLVDAGGLPPKMLVVHRYTGPMVTNANQIRPLPQVQVVMDMDGWGPPSQKFATYNAYVYSEPVQFTGFKLFYRNDTWGGQALLTPEEVLELTPQPSFIQYQ